MPIRARGRTCRCFSRKSSVDRVEVSFPALQRGNAVLDALRRNNALIPTLNID
ncbi:DUF1534 domain-containing protein [Pseudomonas cannabina]|nr:DUF1534 domain-containing protein [Pseudomonas cannabina]